MARIEETTRPRSRCAVYTRKSTEEGLEQDYNSIDTQRDGWIKATSWPHGTTWFISSRKTSLRVFLGSGSRPSVI